MRNPESGINIYFAVSSIDINLSILSVTNGILLLAVISFIIFSIFKDKAYFARPGFILLGALHVFYQWPAFLLSTQIEYTFINALKFIFYVQAPVLALMIWLYFSRNINHQIQIDNKSNSYSNISILNFSLILSVIAILLGVYFYEVPFECSGSYALLYDPSSLLLAREFSAKLIPQTYSSYAYGLIANTLSPVIAGFSVLGVINNIKNAQYVRAFIWFAPFIVAVLTVLVSGIKGMLVPTIIMLMVISWFSFRNIVARSISIIACIGALGIILVLYDVYSKNTLTSKRYDIVECAVELNACDKTNKLLTSMYQREEGGLGLNRDKIVELSDELRNKCDYELGSLEDSVNNGQKQYSVTGKGTDKGTDYLNSSYVQRHGWSIINRAILVPFQVMSWHYLYVENNSSPGFAAIPFTRLFTGQYVNVTELVYQEYGSLYSSGDKTITSTAPTSFIYYYPAYTGLIGLSLAILIIILFDYIGTLMISKVPAKVLSISIGLLTIIVYNFLLSDAVTVFFSHGGGGAVLLLLIWIVIGRNSHNNDQKPE